MAMTLGAGSDAWGIWHARHPAQIPWERYLDEVALAGYRFVEPGLYGYLPRDPLTVRRALAERNLFVPGGTFFAALSGAVPTPVLLAALDDTAGWLAAIGARHLVLLDDFWRDPETGASRRPPRLEEAEWPAFASLLETLGARCREAHGLTLVFHPHCDATVEIEDDIDRLMAMTDPALVGLCLDTGHHLYSGGDPATCLRRHRCRIPYLHLKSMNAEVLAVVRRERLPWAVAVARGVTEEPALGAVDFRAVAAVLRESGYDGFAIVEQDMFPCDPDVPLPLARRSIAYLRGLGFTL